MDVDTALEQLRADPHLRACVRTARDWGVSPGRFLGREPARHVVHDPATGRVALVEAAPEWTDEDRALALALTAYDADACPGCGQQLSETTKAEHEDLYVPGDAVRCHHCTAAARGAERYAESPQPGALFIPVELARPPSDSDLEALVGPSSSTSASPSPASRTLSAGT